MQQYEHYDGQKYERKFKNVTKRKYKSRQCYTQYAAHFKITVT